MLRSVGTSVIAKMRRVCEKFVAGWRASDSANVVSPKNNASGIANEKGHAAHGFVKLRKHPAIWIPRPGSRRVVTQQNEFQDLFATARAATTRPARHVVQGVAIAVLTAAW